MKTKHLLLTAGLLALVGCIATPTARAQLYVAVPSVGSIGTYDPATGAAINANFITFSPNGLEIALSGNILYVAEQHFGKVGTYNATTGAAINANFITGQSAASGIVLSGNTLYLANSSANTVATYDATTGAVINASLIPDLQFINNPGWISLAVSGNDLYVSNPTLGSDVAQYNASTGAVIRAQVLTSGPFQVTGLAASGNSLYVAGSNGVLREYDVTTGTSNREFFGGSVGSLLVSGNTLYAGGQGEVLEYDATAGGNFGTQIFTPGVLVTGLALAAAPEPTSAALLGLGTLLLAARRRRSA